MVSLWMLMILPISELPFFSVQKQNPLTRLPIRILTAAEEYCPSQALTTLATSHGLTSYRYIFSAQFPNTALFPDAGAYHSSELREIFGTYPVDGATPEQIKLAEVMQKVWADFVKDPYSGPGWPAVTTGPDPVLQNFMSDGSAASQPFSATDGVCPLVIPLDGALGTI